MKAWRSDKVSIWPVMDHEPDEPKIGIFAVTLGKGTPERALMVTKEGEKYSVFLDGYPQARPSRHWRQAFGQMITRIPFLAGRPVKQDFYDRLVANRLKDAFDGVDATKPIDLNRARVPF